MATNDTMETNVGNMTQTLSKNGTSSRSSSSRGENRSDYLEDIEDNFTVDSDVDLDTQLPDFRMAKPSNPNIGHNQPPKEEFDPSGELADIRRILVGPLRKESEQRLETLISILEEREAEMIAREKKMNSLLTEINQRSIAMIRRIQKEQRTTIEEMEKRTLVMVEDVKEEYRETISGLGSELISLGERIVRLTNQAKKPVHN